MVVTCYITLPPALNSLYALLCSGITNILVALFLLLTGKIIVEVQFFQLMWFIFSIIQLYLRFTN